MQKVYLLLRSNRQTGPYSLEELLQLNLKPFDLVWVDGRSAAWQYPSEIPALKPYVPETPHADAPFKPIATSAMEEKFAPRADSNSYTQQQNPIPQKPETTKRIFVSVPKTSPSAVEQKTVVQPKTDAQETYVPAAGNAAAAREEEARQNSHPSVSPFAQQKPAEEEVHTNYARSLNEVEEDYTNWMYRQKTKKKSAVNPKDLVLVVLILAVIGSGYYIMSKPSVANAVLPTQQADGQPALQTTGSNLQPQQENEVSPVENTASSIKTNDSKPLKNAKKKNHVSVPKSQTVGSVPSSRSPMPVEKATPNIQTNHDIVSTNEPEVKQTSQPENRSTKKKKLGDVLKTIFSKKEKTGEPTNNDVVLEDPKPADNRQAQRRGGEESTDNQSGEQQASQASSTALADQIDIYANNTDNWMMGVKNLKLTLRNRSNATIQTAAVTVNYYNENNELLEKKLVYFSNVAPRSKATAAAPDSKYADHVDFKLASVSAKDDRYAKY